MTQVPLADETSEALRVAGRRAEGRPVGSAELLTAIQAVDAAERWDRLRLHISDADSWVDADEDVAVEWDGVPLNGTVYEALWCAAALADGYQGYDRVLLGHLVVGLLAQPATASLVGSNTDACLLRRVATEDLLGGGLTDLEHALTIVPPGGLAHPLAVPDDASVAMQAAARRMVGTEPRATDLLVMITVRSWDDEVTRLLELAGIDDDEYLRAAHAMQKGEDDALAADVVSWGRERFDTDRLTLVQLLAAALGTPSTAMTSLLWHLGHPRGEQLRLHAQAAALASPKRQAGVTRYAFVALEYALRVLAAVLVAVHSFGDGTLWHLMLIVPSLGSIAAPGLLAGLAVAVAVGWLTTPIIGAVLVGTALVSVLGTVLDRRHLRMVTGVHLRLAPFRRYVRAQLAMKSRSAARQFHGLHRIWVYRRQFARTEVA